MHLLSEGDMCDKVRDNCGNMIINEREKHHKNMKTKMKNCWCCTFSVVLETRYLAIVKWKVTVKKHKLHCCSCIFVTVGKELVDLCVKTVPVAYYMGKNAYTNMLAKINQPDM